MALAKNLTLTDNFGIEVTIPNVYIKIVRLDGTKDNMSATVYCYKSQNGDILKQSTHSFAPALDGSNFIAQGYAHIKTLEAFAGAQDC
jgi:hypothetical protein